MNQMLGAGLNGMTTGWKKSKLHRFQFTSLDLRISCYSQKISLKICSGLSLLRKTLMERLLNRELKMWLVVAKISFINQDQPEEVSISTLTRSMKNKWPLLWTNCNTTFISSDTQKMKDKTNRKEKITLVQMARLIKNSISTISKVSPNHKTKKPTWISLTLMKKCSTWESTKRIKVSSHKSWSTNLVKASQCWQKKTWLNLLKFFHWFLSERILREFETKSIRIKIN